MRKRPVVVHLIDDTTAGGVMRVLDHITTSADMAQIADHRLVRVDRGQISLQRHRCDVIVSHLSISWRTLPVFVALKLANRHARLVHVEHSYTEAFVHHNVPNLRRFHTLLKTAFTLFDRVVAVSEGQAAWLRRAGLCPDHRLSVIRSCVDLAPFQSLPPARPAPRVIGAIGRLDRQKGFDTLIAAFRETGRNDVSLHIYGTGDQSEALRAHAGDDTRIQFRGHVDDPLAAYRDVDILVVPSLWEAYGLVAIEALCAGRTVLCADVDGLRDHADYGAQLLPETTVDQMKARLNAILGDTGFAEPRGDRDVGRHLQGAFVAGWRDLIGGLCPS